MKGTIRKNNSSLLEQKPEFIVKNAAFMETNNQKITRHSLVPEIRAVTCRTGLIISILLSFRDINDKTLDTKTSDQQIYSPLCKGQGSPKKYETWKTTEGLFRKNTRLFN